jgi:PAS domain-containing protein
MSSLFGKVFQDADISLNVLQVLVTNTYDSILITDASKDAKIVYANKAFKTLTGYDPSEVIGKTPRILQGSATPFIMYWRVLPVKVGNQVKFWVAIQREGFVI